MGGSRCASYCAVHITSDCHGFISAFKNQSSLTLDIRFFEKNCFRMSRILWYSYLMSELSEGYRTYVIHHSGSKRIEPMVLVLGIICFSFRVFYRTLPCMSLHNKHFMTIPLLRVYVVQRYNSEQWLQTNTYRSNFWYTFEMVTFQKSMLS